MSLILTRKVGEAVIINGDTRVELIKHANGQLGFKVDAHPDVDVYREEITKRGDFNPKRRAQQKRQDDNFKDDNFNAVLTEMDMQARGNVK